MIEDKNKETANHKDDATSTWFFSFSLLITLVNFLFGIGAFQNAFYGAILIIFFSPLYNLLFLVVGIVKILKLRKQYPDMNYKKYWLIVIGVPVMAEVLFLWATSFIEFHGC